MPVRQRLSPPEPAGTASRSTSPRVLVGGVGYRWLGDASFGLSVSDQLATVDLGSGVEVADLGYGALYVALDLADARPAYDRLILVAAVTRGRQPGHLYRRRWHGQLPASEEIVARVREAVAGVVDLDHLLVVAEQLGALPRDVVVLELEPVVVAGGCELSEPAARLVGEAIERVRREAAGPARPTPVAGR